MAPKYLFPKPQQNKSPKLDNLAATPAAQKAAAQKALEPLMEVFSLLASAPLRAATEAATYSSSAEAAFITPRAGATNLRKFADATLEHLPNPSNLKWQDLNNTTVGELYSTSKQGRDILNNVPGLRSATVRMSEDLPPNSRGRFLYDPATRTNEILINAFPLTGEFKPLETLTHEVQHVIDALQKRVSGTSPDEAGKVASDLIAKDVEANILPDGTIEKKTLSDILDQTDVDVYQRNVGENRARIDANQFPQFENFATWFEDVFTGDFKTGR